MLGPRKSTLRPNENILQYNVSAWVLQYLPVCDPVPASEVDIGPWVKDMEENTEDLSSYMPLVVEKETECRLGDTGLDVLVGDTDEDRLGGEPGGVSQGVEPWDAKRRFCGTLGLGAAIVE